MRPVAIAIFFVLILNPRISECQEIFTRQDSLRGGYGPGRNNWDLLHYELRIRPDHESKSIEGLNIIQLKMLSEGPIQIDLMEPMEIYRVWINGSEKTPLRNGNVWIIDNDLKAGTTASIRISFHGRPVIAKRAPWDGGWIFTKDKEGNPWMTVACQGLGASSWFPCKDSQQDEPDSGCIVHIDVPDTLVGVGPGRMTGKMELGGGRMMYTWKVANPINNYSIIPYIGKYVHFGEKFSGEKGELDLDYWVMKYNEAKAREHFKQVPGMLKAFEYWLGPYPFYEDSYKLTEAPFLGMEHQSGIAYGNGYRNGYAGDDLSGTGVGKKWDFMIVHESGHEWFGNSITAKDIADIWIHESFTSYSEILYIDYHFGKEAADTYSIGYRKSIENKYPCIGTYGVQDDPAHRSSDVYAKGAALLHNIRQQCDNDEQFRQMLRAMNRRFYHQTVTTAEIESFICQSTGIGRSVFDQYLRSTQIPLLEFKLSPNGKYLHYRWSDAVNGFSMKVKMQAGSESFFIEPKTQWKKRKLSNLFRGKNIAPDKRYYINYRQL